MKRIILFTLLFLSTTIFYSQTLSKEDVLPIIEKAERGDDDAQFMLGKFYQEGNGVELSYQKAIYWYEKAAAQKNPLAQLFLATGYHLGNFGQKDYYNAKYWYEKLLETESAESQFLYGMFLLDEKNPYNYYSLGVSYIEKAANQNHKDAQYRLAMCYVRGKGVAQSYNDAMYWFKKACENMLDKACEMYNEMKKYNR